MSTAPRPKSTPSAVSPAKGGWVQRASSPGGTTSVWPAKTRCGAPLPMVAKRLSTSGVPGAEKVSRSTAKPASARISAIHACAPPSAGVTERHAISALRKAAGSNVWVIGLAREGGSGVAACGLARLACGRQSKRPLGVNGVRTVPVNSGRSVAPARRGWGRGRRPPRRAPPATAGRPPARLPDSRGLCYFQPGREQPGGDSGRRNRLAAMAKICSIG